MGETRYHDHGAVEAQGPTGLRVDPIDVVQERDIHHDQGEDNVRSVEGVVKYVRKTVGYEQGVFDTEIVQSINV